VIHFLDSAAHLLRRVRLIPEALLERLCDAYDRALGAFDEPVADVVAAFETGEKGRTAPPPRLAGYRCEHTSVTAGGAVTLTGPPTSWCGCTMTPTY
jgi:hypothetical protein